jgi:hypothetical protein
MVLPKYVEQRAIDSNDGTDPDTVMIENFSIPI